MEEPARERCRLQVLDDARAAGLTEDGDARRIAAERFDVARDPLQRRDLIEQAVGPGRVMLRLGAQQWMREEAECTETVGDAHHHQTVRRERAPSRDGSEALPRRMPPPWIHTRTGGGRRDPRSSTG